MLLSKTMDKRCPRNLKSFPEAHCPMGKDKAERMGKGRFNVEKLLPNECVWYMNCDQNSYCFFKYMKNNPRPHSLKEIAKLWNTSINNIKLREREALNNFKQLVVQARKQIENKADILRQKEKFTTKRYKYSFRIKNTTKKINEFNFKLSLYNLIEELIREM